MIFDDFVSKLGKKYEEDFKLICDSSEYNNKKMLDLTLSIHQYIQASSEAIYYYFLRKKDENIEYDKRVNLENGTDVDISCNIAGYRINLEVKTPELFENTSKYKEGMIYGHLNHRYPDDMITKEDVDKEMKEIVGYFQGKADIKKMDDNKLKDYLVGCNDKVIPSDEATINVLLICLDSSTMGSFLSYILNEYTGLFSNNPFVPAKEYEKVDYIMLSNCVEAHLDSNFKFNVWDASNYINFVIPNYNKKIIKGEKDLLNNIFNDSFDDYCKKRNGLMCCEGNNLGDEFAFSNYLAEDKNLCFCQNHEKRKY